jgi:hypothetical protein
MQEQLKPTQEEPFEPVKQAQGTKGNRARDKKKKSSRPTCVLSHPLHSHLLAQLSIGASILLFTSFVAMRIAATQYCSEESLCISPDNSRTP